MALEDVIARFCNACNDTETADVTREAAPALGVTPVTRVTHDLDKAEAKTETPGGLQWLRARGCTDAGPEEVRYLLRHLPQDRQARRQVLDAYVFTWLTVAEATPLPHQKQGAGRRAANIALREGRLTEKTVEKQ